MFFILKMSKWNYGEISILVNDLTKIDKEIVILIAKNVKRLNIITNHIEKFNKLDKYLYNEFGIVLNISNNKKESLRKSKIIVNLDFPEELLNKYIIYEKAIIFNIIDKIKILTKRFSGINITYYNIEIPNKYKIDGFNDEIIYESKIYSYDNIDVIRKNIKKDKIKIKELLGLNGIITKKELYK